MAAPHIIQAQAAAAQIELRAIGTTWPESEGHLSEELAGNLKRQLCLIIHVFSAVCAAGGRQSRRYGSACVLYTATIPGWWLAAQG